MLLQCSISSKFFDYLFLYLQLMLVAVVIGGYFVYITDGAAAMAGSAVIGMCIK